jgi:amidohydrolase
MLMGVARLLSKMPDRPPGQVRFLFQPSEEASDDENKSGAVRMIEDDALEGVDAVIALHVDSMTEAGKIMLESGYTSANEDSFTIQLMGDGGHGAMPHMGVDPVFILAQVINAINGIRARRVDPAKAAAISIGSIHAGVAANVIPRMVTITGTMRSFEDEVREQLKTELAQMLEVARALGGDFTLTIKPGYPSMYNDPEVCALMQKTITDMLGEDALLHAEPMMGAEDFSYMTRKAPGAMFMLGAKYDDIPRAHHTPVFDINESVLPKGAALLAEMACRLLRDKAS